MKNINFKKIETELDELVEFIDGHIVDSEVDYIVKNKVANIKKLLHIQNKPKDKIVFQYEDDTLSCKIIQLGVALHNGSFIFSLDVDGEDWVSIENGIECKNDGVYNTFEECMDELCEACEAFYGEDVVAKIKK